MAVTASQIIRRALRILTVIDSNEALEASAEQDAREALNNIGQRWLASGMLPAWQDATGPTFALATEPAANDALSYALALSIAPEFGRELSPAVVAAAQRAIITLWRDRLVETGEVNAKAIILRALRLMPDPARLPDGVNLAGALRTLNALLAEWHEAGIGLPDYKLDTLDSAPASDAADRDAIAYELVVRLAPEYGVQITNEIASAGRQSMFRLRSRYLQASHPVPSVYY